MVRGVADGQLVTTGNLRLIKSDYLSSDQRPLSLALGYLLSPGGRRFIPFAKV
jgi:hypothetical protein